LRRDGRSSFVQAPGARARTARPPDRRRPRRTRAPRGRCAGEEGPHDLPTPVPWRSTQTLDLVEANALPEDHTSNGKAGIAVVCASLDDVRLLAARAVGIAPIELDAASAKGLRGQKAISLPAPSLWAERASTPVALGGAKVPLTWL